MIKKLNPIIWTLLVLFSAFSWTSCDKEDSGEPLSLVNIENNVSKLYYGYKDGVTIIGGDGIYSFSCESPLLKAEMTHSNYILFEPLGVGDATVTIKDSSGNSYLLTVTIAYRTQKIIVSKIGATVVGDAMTVGDQKELKEKALATIPVKVGGGYKFVYTERDKAKGIVLIYTDKYGDNGIEGTFERATVKNKDGNYSYTTYTMHYNGLNRTFILTKYSQVVLRSTGDYYGQFQFAEDLTEQYKTAYPNVEQVYTLQMISSMDVE